MSVQTNDLEPGIPYEFILWLKKMTERIDARKNADQAS